MRWEEQYRELISGRRRGRAAVLLRGVLSFAASLYGAAVYCRNQRFDRSASAIHRVPVPVVSVGNLTTGGTGKTPLVAWLAGWFQARGLRVVLISRGYGAKSGTPNDEAWELARQLPGVPHLQNRDRVAAARTAVEKFACQVIVLDDAFQHRRIHRDVDLVLIDALAPFGYGHLLPRGLLRERVSALRRAHIVALSRADLVSDVERQSLRSQILRHAPQAEWIELAHRPSALISATGESMEVGSLRGQRVAAFCGIGNPQGFRQTLARSGAEIVAFREFPDHYAYGNDDIAALGAWASTVDVAAVICTMKDFVKLQIEQLGRRPLRALAIDVELLSGRSEFESRLHELAARGAAR